MNLDEFEPSQLFPISEHPVECEFEAFIGEFDASPESTLSATTNSDHEWQTGYYSDATIDLPLHATGIPLVQSVYDSYNALQSAIFGDDDQT